MAGNIYAWDTTAANNDDADTTINWAEGQLPSTVNNSARAMMAVHAAFLKDNNATSTTSGTGAAYTVTSNLTSTLATGLVFRLKMNATNTGACTLNVTPSGGAAFGAKAIKVLGVGGEADPVPGAIQANGIYILNYDSTAASSAGAYILCNPSVPDVSRISGFRYGLAASASTSALTVSLTTAAGSTPSASDPVFITFRSSAGPTGTVSPVAVTGSTSLVISPGSTLGVTSSTAFRVWIVGFSGGGTATLGAVNCSTSSSTATTIYGVLNGAGQLYGGFGSSTAEGGAGAADSAGVIYSSAAVSAVPMRILGFLEWSASGLTAGTWTTTNLTTIQTYESGMGLPGEIIQVNSSVSSTTAATNATTYTSSGYTLAITPTSATNIIRFHACGNIVNSAGEACFVRASRGTVANTNMIGNEAEVLDSTSTVAPFALTALDKPNVGTSTTYAIQIKSAAGGTATIGGNLALISEIQEIVG